MLSVVLHVTGIFRLTSIIENFGGIMTTAIIWGFTMSFLVYTTSMIKGTQHRMSGKPIYDFFMGAPLNPRIGPVDLKMWAECRVPWPILFFTSVSCALKQYELRGYVSGPVAFMVLAHFLYTNACQKGEECIPTSFDMFYEKDGKMHIIKSRRMLCIKCVRFRFHAYFLEHGRCPFHIRLFLNLSHEIRVNYW